MRPGTEGVKCIMGILVVVIPFHVRINFCWTFYH
ncbi:hypothetical protein E2C01_065800 [Portunus trituberculatus]|uniref:Uncharacterized protein n=1 Tax=Portunus trituberculatus TaxID=210409 RepID=A0A5B7HN27_PORTR|nr:hypothetical protein [Portunus trituberculatus]